MNAQMFSMWLCLVPRYTISLVRLPTSDINCKSSMMYVLIHIHTHSIVDQIINGELCSLVYIPALCCLYYVNSLLGNASSFEVFFATVNYHVSFAFQTGVIDMDNDWKLLTLLIGGNDLCQRWVMGADKNMYTINTFTL